MINTDSGVPAMCGRRESLPVTIREERLPGAWMTTASVDRRASAHQPPKPEGEPVPETTSSWASGIQAITLFVADLAAAKRFYADVFELKVVYEDSDAVTLQLGPTLINALVDRNGPELIEPARVASADAGARAMYTIQVADVDATAGQLESRGVSLLNGPIDRPWGVRTAAFSDPAGHIWEIAAPLRKA
jgi:catechol 2,3-dioxygenase-like lactoylglutathione lyase family enzyme